MNKGSSGSWGIAALIGLGLLGFGLRKVLPSLGSLLLWGAAIGGVLIVLLVAVVMYFAFAKPKEEKQGAEDMAMLSKGRAKMVDIRRMDMRIKDPAIRKQNGAICTTADQILRKLKAQPEDIPRMRQFFSYYLPTWGNILQKYLRLEESSMADLRMSESMVLCLRDIQTAMDKLYQNLFEDDILDLTVEMEVLNMVAKRDGLLEEGTLQMGEME